MRAPSEAQDAVYRVLIADDHPHGREGMRDIVESDSAFVVAGEAMSGEEAVEAAERLRPDLVLMGANMPGIGGLEASQRIKRRHPGVRIVIVTAHDEPAFLFEALRRGAQGFLPKNVNPSAWRAYLRSIMVDETPMSSELARMMLAAFRGGGADERRNGNAPADSARETAEADGHATPLTPRERDVLRRVAQGESNREIADRLCISEHTVKNHLKNILQKLHLDNRVQLARYAYESGMAGGTEG